MSTIIERIAAHRAAWQAFQDAPYDPEGTPGYELASRAELAMHEALDVLLQTVPTTPADLIGLKAHLDWYVLEEADGPGFDIDLVRAVHAAITLAQAPGLALALLVKDWFTPKGGIIDTPENLEHQGFDGDAEVLRAALVVAP